jgi:hypothetical protein
LSMAQLTGRIDFLRKAMSLLLQCYGVIREHLAGTSFGRVAVDSR